MLKHAQPTPVVVTEVCSLCGLDWRRHGADPTTEDCIRLLRADLAAARPVVVPFAVRPWPQPIYPRGPYWYGDLPTTTVYSSNTVEHTPRRAEITCMSSEASR